jgi:hypothetical protein
MVMSAVARSRYDARSCTLFQFEINPKAITFAVGMNLFTRERNMDHRTRGRKIQISIRISSPMLKLVDDRATLRGLSRSEVIQRAVERYFDKDGDGGSVDENPPARSFDREEE